MDEYARSTQLAEDVGRLLRNAGATLVTAESCTGGLLGHLITEVAGSSDYFKGGVVSYSNELKEALLGVRHVTLMEYGAVSAEVAREMADSVRRRLESEYALSITGIAGPGGGTAEKPVGLTYIGLATPVDVQVQRYVWQGSRSHNKLASVRAALELLYDYLSPHSGG